MFNLTTSAGTVEESQVVMCANDDLASLDADRCGQHDEHFFNAFQFWISGVLDMTFGIIGLIGAILAVAVLANKELRTNLFNQLLMALAICDLIFIICAVPFCFHYFGWLEQNEAFYNIKMHLFYPGTAVTLDASVFITVAMTVERYLAVRKPFCYRTLNLENSVYRRLMLYMLPVLVTSIAMNIPRFTEMGVSKENDTLVAVYSEIMKNPSYVWYYSLSQLFHPTITIGVVPMVVLAFMNISILVTVHKSYSMQSKIRGSNSGKSEQGEKTTKNLAFVLTAVIITHFICHLPIIIVRICMQYYLNDYIYCIVHGIPFHYPSWFRCINITTALLSTIKCSCHFFIYCFSHKSSKARLRQLGFIGGKKKCLGRQNTNKSGRSENVTNSTDLEDSTDLNSSNPNENSKWNVLRHFVRDGSIQSRLDAAASTQL